MTEQPHFHFSLSCIRPGLAPRPLSQGQAGLLGLQLSVVEDHGVSAGQQAAVGGQAAAGHPV